MGNVRIKRSSLLYRIYDWYTEVESKNPNDNFLVIVLTVFFAVPFVWLLETGFRIKGVLVYPLALIQVAGVFAYIAVNNLSILNAVVLLFTMYALLGIVLFVLTYDSFGKEYDRGSLPERYLMAVLLPVFAPIMYVIAMFCILGKYIGDEIAQTEGYQKFKVLFAKKVISTISKAGSYIKGVLSKKVEFID